LIDFGGVNAIGVQNQEEDRVVAEQKSPAVDPFAAWRDWLEQTERQLNSYFNQVMGTEQYARFLGQFSELTLNMQKNMGEAMERYFKSLNLPTREDLTLLGQRLNVIEQRVAALERNSPAANLVAGAAAPEVATPPRPPRTRKPPSNEGKES
jgi:Poly(R)-hydroxyalkanoic acid synthase subunit (PHA_synth_III_E)